MKNEQVAEIVPLPERAPNGATIIAVLAAWEGGAIKDEIEAAVVSVREPHPRDEERLAWVDEDR
jgi:hypothetical protein